ncbi:transposase [Anaerobacillus sp. CMMVII]|uniref:transposase n=1 Tax=Anaerobacillus sp. CMMVII TaxID=2755588 RepID=UPI0021B78ECE|nr:transposase [Anaerobacillus sp. CMMVII]MCT8140161.1 transposase [Anaerobacillus sp. CMMVII]
MPRKKRVWFKYAMYHITNRGVRKMAIFYQEDDYLKYLEILEETRQQYPFTLHAYCLMTNHVHLLLQTLDHPISIIMKQLNTQYAKYFNKKYNLVGHLFQSRFGSELIDSLKYELDVSKYIHLNPVEAYMVDKAEDYRWSSYRAYAFHESNPHVHTEKILSHFPPPASYHYQQFTEQQDKLDPPPIIIKPFVGKFDHTR